MSTPGGTKNPPESGRFKKGKSGNPKGRPKAQRKASASAFDVVIDKTLTVMQGGVSREMTVDEALQQQTLQQAVAGNRSAQRAVFKMIVKREKARAVRDAKTAPPAAALRIEPVDPRNADAVMLMLGIASPSQPRDGTMPDAKHLVLEPWAVQAALDRRRGVGRMSPDDVRRIKGCTRDNETLRWPRGVDGD